ncbi:hypothetical protein [Salarchaeum japonicum]|uniref:Uncharacterized protein n=1 Tax=Salarchaeum japonicum TaxID=555573 RepID=A0AAV3T065_9EURY|nr:hypothetical protein [Salarchaeum japonicum]
MANPVEKAVRQLQQVPTARNTLSASDFETKDAVAGERTRVATHQFNRPVAVKGGETYNIDLIAHERFTSDGTTGDQEEFTVSHNVFESPSIPVDVVAYEDGSRLSVDSVDYGADTVSVTPANADSTIDLFYVSADQARLEIRKTAPNGTFETIDEADIGLANRRNQNKTPLRFDFDHPLQGVLPTDWSLDIYVDGPYEVAWSLDNGASATNQLVSIPIERSEREIPDWVEDVVAQVAATR